MRYKGKEKGELTMADVREKKDIDEGEEKDSWDYMRKY